MPELPEVEVMRRYFAEAVGDQIVVEVEFHDHLNKIFKSSKEEIRQHLIEQHFTGSQRVGKYLFLQLSSGKWLLFHFGMTGSLQLLPPGQEYPAHTRFVMHLQDENRMIFRDLRKFGRIHIIDDPAEYCRRHKLGKDLLAVEKEEFSTWLSQRPIAVKTALLEQHQFAGIGNWMADEILFRVGIHPEERASNLSQKELHSLWQVTMQVCREAIDADTHYGDFPSHFFTNYRKTDALHPDHPKSAVQRLLVGGRGTFLVPEKQKLKSED